MKSITAIRNSVVALALGVGSSMMPASTLFAEPAPPRQTIEVTTQDVAASNAKVQAAYDALVTMWSADFKQIGERFDAPEIMRYRSPIRTACGVMTPSNAGYCPVDNTIYFDDVFLAGQAKLVAPKADAQLDLSDTTLPDLVVGEEA